MNPLTFAIRYGILWLISGSLLSASLQAQPYIDILSLETQYFVPVPYKQSPGQLLANEQTAQVFVPLPQQNKDVVLLSGKFKRLQLSHSTSGISPVTFLAPSLRIGYQKHWSQQWKTTVIGIPKVSSDFKNWGIHHWQLGGVLLFTYSLSPDLTVKGGLYYNHEYFGHFFMPLAGIDWRVTNKLYIFGVLPGEMNVEYQLSNNFFSGLRYRDITTSYLRGSFPRQYIREGHPFWGHNQLHAFLEYYVWENGVISLQAGYTAWRRYALYDKGDKIKSHSLFQPIQNGPYFKIGVAYRVFTQ